MRLLSTIRETVRQFLRDEYAGTDYEFPEDEIDLHISQVLTEISERRPREVKETVYATNKSGTATSTSANHLVDATKAQFVAGDVGKTVYNSTDKTTAKITTLNSSSDVTLDTDIMASGDSYYIYDTDCTSAKEVSIASIEDSLEVEKAEYPTRQDPKKFVNVSVFGDVLTLDTDSAPTDGDEVFLYCHTNHSLTESSSTLTPKLERILIEGAVFETASAWLNKMRKQVLPTSVNWYQAWVDRQERKYMASVNSLSRSRVWEF